MKIKHRVYWGTHGCDKAVPHGGYCRCQCKVWLPLGVEMFGEEVHTARPAPHCLGTKLKGLA